MFNSFPGGEMTQQICNKIFHEIQNQTLSQKDRYTTYSIFLNLLTYHLAGKLCNCTYFICSSGSVIAFLSSHFNWACTGCESET